MSALEHARLLNVFDISADASARAFAKIDSDGDGKLSKDDVRQRLEEFFLSDDDAALGNSFWGI